MLRGNAAAREPFATRPLVKRGAVCYDKEKEGTTARRLPLHERNTVKEMTATFEGGAVISFLWYDILSREYQ